MVKTVKMVTMGNPQPSSKQRHLIVVQYKARGVLTHAYIESILAAAWTRNRANHATVFARVVGFCRLHYEVLWIAARRLATEM